MDKSRETPPSPISIHLVNAVLDAVNEAVAEMLEQAEQHQSVAPEASMATVALAIFIMQATAEWLQQWKA